MTPADKVLERYPALVAFFRSQLRPDLRSQAEDLAQESLLAAWRALSRGEGEAIRDGVSYLLGIAYKKLADALRRGAGTREVSMEEFQEEGGIVDRIRQKSAEYRAIETEERSRVRTALRRLKPLDRDLITLCFLDGLSHADACSKLGIDQQTGYRRKHRALEKLRFQLRAYR